MGSSIWSRAATHLVAAPIAPVHLVSDAMALFLEQTRPDRGARIGVLGPDAGEALSSLWRRGFKRAEAARMTHATPDHDEARLDLLFVAGSTSADRATLSIANAAPGLKRGGALVVDLGAMPADAEGAALIARLAPLGFAERPALSPHIQILADKIGEPVPG
jgi:hypothetical protein